MQIGHAKALAIYLAGATLLAIYGGQVCPFIDTLRIQTVFLTLVGIFLIGWVLRFSIFHLSENSSRPVSREPWRFLLVDLSAWILIGVMATAWNMWRHNFPIGSGLKLVVGCLTMGVLASTYLALEAEEKLLRACETAPDLFQRERSHFISLSTKFFAFITASLILFSVVIALLVLKDLKYALENPKMEQPQWMFRAVAVEISFVLVLLLAGCCGIARQFSRNLRLTFGLIQTALDKVQQGIFSTEVPVVSNDELSSIAQHTNKMIAGLRDRERIKTIFGKYVSPAVADCIMKSEKGSELGGREVRVAILFTDIRNYTTLSEKLSPTEVVDFLNFYFSKVVEAVHGANGIVDKFIGDAAMAVFGIDGSENAASDAVNAGFRIRSILKQVNEHLQKKGYPQIDNGIGIHYGPVIAGNIGSEQRLEYTVIGDAVNTASRIETLCKTQAHKLLISASAFEKISPSLREHFSALGEFDLKGKSQAVTIYGAEA
jgi:adenylate cyclase